MSNICNFSLFSNQSNNYCNLIFVKLQALTKFANVSITVLLVCSGKRPEDWRLGRIIWHEVPSILQYYRNHINIAYSRKCLQSPYAKNNNYYTLLYYSKVLLVSSCKINLNIPQLSMIFQAIFQSWKKVNNNHEDCCIVTIIVIVRLEDSYSKHWVEWEEDFALPLSFCCWNAIEGAEIQTKVASLLECHLNIDLVLLESKDTNQLPNNRMLAGGNQVWTVTVAFLYW